MPLFECVTCGVVENTAICEYWSQQHEYLEEHDTLENFAGECSQCRLGTWHGEFPRMAAKNSHYVRDDHTGFLLEPPDEQQKRRQIIEFFRQLPASEQARLTTAALSGCLAPAGPPPPDPPLPQLKRSSARK